MCKQDNSTKAIYWVLIEQDAPLHIKILSIWINS